MILASASPTSLILSVLAAAAYAWPALRAQHLSRNDARGWVAVAWLLHAALVVLGLIGTPPFFGFAPALSVTAWLVALVYAIETHVYPQLATRWTVSVWLPMHLAFGIACYGLFGTAVVHAWFMTRVEDRIRQGADSHSGLPLLTLERLTFRFVAAGFVLLTATLLVGYLFGDVVYGHGHAWRWDHKTIFSVLSWVMFAALLVGRNGFGWRGKRAIRMLYAGSVFLLLAYVGSRFVLEVVLRRGV
jgi:ABC-type uncharacterized transport system permease subunit